MTLYEQMKDNIEKNKDMMIKPAPPIVECKRMKELRDRMDRICKRIKRKNGWI